MIIELLNNDKNNSPIHKNKMEYQNTPRISYRKDKDKDKEKSYRKERGKDIEDNLKLFKRIQITLNKEIISYSPKDFSKIS